MREYRFMGYKVNRNIQYFLPNMILFSNEKENITVAMAEDALDYILGIIEIKNPLVEPYKTAKVVFKAMKNRLENKRSSKPSKMAMKTAVEVLEEIFNLGAKTEEEKERNTKNAFFCKMVIERFHEGI